MNVLFLSPTFPASNTGFAKQLIERDVQVLGVGDMGYDRFSPEQRSSLTEYYFVTSLEDYDSVYRAAAFFIHKYGRIDSVVSLNAYWQPLASALRQEYGISGVTNANALVEGPCHVTYEALLDGTGQPVLEMSRAVHGTEGAYTLSTVDQTVRNGARNVLAALGVRNDFVTVEMRRAGRGYSVVNAYASPSAFAPDLFNYVFAFDVYSAWAHLVTGGTVERAVQKQAVAMIHTVDGQEYPGVSAEYFSALEPKILQESPASDALVNAVGDTVYIIGAEDENEARGILSAFAGSEIPPLSAPKATRQSEKTSTRQTSVTRSKTAATGKTKSTGAGQPETEPQKPRRKPGPKPKSNTDDKVVGAAKENTTVSKKRDKKSTMEPDLTGLPVTKERAAGVAGRRTGKKTTETVVAVTGKAVAEQPAGSAVVSAESEEKHKK